MNAYSVLKLAALPVLLACAETATSSALPTADPSRGDAALVTTTPRDPTAINDAVARSDRLLGEYARSCGIGNAAAADIDVIPLALASLGR